MQHISELLEKNPTYLEIRNFASNDPNSIVDILEKNKLMNKIFVDNNPDNGININTWFVPMLKYISSLNIKKIKIWVPFDKDNIEPFAEYIKNNNTLKCLDLTYSNIPNEHNDLMHDAIASNSPIFKFYLAGDNTYNDDDIRIPCPKNNIDLLNLLTDKYVKVLHLKNYIIDEKISKILTNINVVDMRIFESTINCDTFSKVIDNNMNMKKIMLDECDFDVAPLNIFKSIENSQNLVTFYYNKNIHSLEIGKSIRSIIENNKFITYYCFYNTMDEECLLQVVKGMKHNNIVKKFDISQKNISGKALKILMKSPAPIENLDLSWSDVTDGGFEALASALRNNNILKVLNLEHCFYVTSKSIIALIQSLETNSTLEILNLEGYYENDDCAKAIYKMLKINTCLKELNVTANSFSGWGCNKIYEALKINCALEKINIHNDKIENNKYSELLTPEMRQQKYDRLFCTKSAKI